MEGEEGRDVDAAPEVSAAAVVEEEKVLLALTMALGCRAERLERWGVEMRYGGPNLNPSPKIFVDVDVDIGRRPSNVDVRVYVFER